MARKNSKRGGKSKAQAAKVRRVKRHYRADEYRSRTVASMIVAEPVHTSRRLPDPVQCGAPEHVARWVVRKVELPVAA